MSGVTDDPTNPGIKRGPPDETPVPQNETYLVLSAAERAKGFVRPVRTSYRHVGMRPKFELRPLTPEEETRYASLRYVAFEAYPESESPATGRYWTKAQLESGCGAVTTMGLALAETYARNPGFYGSTYCVGCQMHRPVGEAGEFVWTDGGSKVGT